MNKDGLRVLFCVGLATLAICFLVNAYAQDVPVNTTLYHASLGSSAQCILPPRNVRTVPKWADATGQVLRAGSVYEASNGRTYLVVIGGTTTNSPTNTSGVLAYDGGIAWRPVQGVAVPRTGLALYNPSTSYVYAAFGWAPAVNEGIHLIPLTGSFVIPSGAPQAPLFAISGTVTSLVTAQDW